MSHSQRPNLENEIMFLTKIPRCLRARVIFRGYHVAAKCTEINNAAKQESKTKKWAIHVGHNCRLANVILTTINADIFLVGAVMATPVIVATDSNFSFCANAFHFVQPYVPLSNTICSTAPHLAAGVAQLPTYDCGISIVKTIITNCSPFTIVEYLNSPFLWKSVPSQSHCNGKCIL